MVKEKIMINSAGNRIINKTDGIGEETIICEAGLQDVPA
jgi:hypothetical protein